MGATDTDYDMPIMLYLRGISVRDLNHVLESIYKGNLNCAGIIDAALNGCNFPAKEYTSLGSAGGIYHFRDRNLTDDGIKAINALSEDDADEDDAGADYPAANSWSGRQRS